MMWREIVSFLYNELWNFENGIKILYNYYWVFITYGKKNFDENFIFRAIPLVKFLMGVKFIGL